MGTRTSSRSEAPDLWASLREERQAHGHVAVVDGNLRVADFRTSNPDVTRYFEERLDDDTDLTQALELVLKVGVNALSSVGASVNVDYVEKEFLRLGTMLEQKLSERIGAVEEALEEVFSGEDGELRQALQTYLGEGGHLAELFDPNRRDSAVSRLKDILGEHFDGESSKLHRLLDMSNPRGPLSSWKREMDQQFDRIRHQLENYRKDLSEQTAAQVAAANARAEERERGTQKGRDFEEAVFEAVNGIAAVFGDVAEPTGDLAASGGSSKVGDIVVALNERDTRGASVRLVFEAKDKGVGLTPMLRELDHARDNRGASGAIAVYSREDWMPTGCAPFREQGGGRYLVLFDKESLDPLCLQVAYRLARFTAIADLATEDVDIDARGIREDLEAARHQLGNVASMKGKLTKMRNNLDEAASDLEQQLEALRSGIVQILDRIDGRIRLDTVD